MNGLNKAGALAPGSYSSWQWTRDGEQVASIGQRATESGTWYCTGAAVFSRQAVRCPS